MSNIYVQSTDMPTSCLKGGCPIDGEFCSLWEEKYWKSPDEPYRKRHLKCPLVPVPTPHGRLIDADRLKADNPRHMNLDVPYVTEVTVEEIIDDAPTIIPASKEDE